MKRRELSNRHAFGQNKDTLVCRLFFFLSCVGGFGLFVTPMSLPLQSKGGWESSEGGSLQEAKPWSGVYDFIAVGTSCYLRRFT